MIGVIIFFFGLTLGASFGFIVAALLHAEGRDK